MFPSRSHCWALSGLLLYLSVTALAAAAVPLDQEARLDQTLDRAVKEEPLADFVAQVGKQTGVDMIASEEVADERITLFARQRPARELLTRIAQHLDYTWTRQTRAGVKTWVLTQDLAARRREGALRGGLQQELDKLRERIEEQASLLDTPEGREIARKPMEWRVERIQELDERLNGKWVGGTEGDQGGRSRLPSAPLKPQEQQRLNRELRVLHSATPGQSSFHALAGAARLYAALPLPEQAALWNGEWLRFAYPAETERLPLSPEVARTLGEMSLGSISRRLDERTGREVAVPLKSLERLRGELWVERQGLGLQLQVRLRALGSLGDDGLPNQVERVFQGTVETGRHWPTVSQGPFLDEKASGLRVPITLPPAQSRPEDEHSTRFLDVLEELSTRVPYPILADGYTTGVLRGQFIADRKPLAEVLTRTCRTFSRRCSYDQGYLRFRHTDWATRRAMEPPALRVRQWEKRLETYGALPFADLIEIGGRLTPEQSAMLLVRWRGQIPDGVYWSLQHAVVQSGAMLRLLQLLPAGARRSLEEGQPIPFRLLSPTGRRHARTCVLQATSRLGSFIDGLTLDGKPWIPGSGFLEEDRQEAAWSRATLALQRKPAVWFVGSMGFLLTSDVKEAIEAELPFNPKVTPKDLKRIEGEQVTVMISLPGTEPVSHFFLVPITKEPS